MVPFTISPPIANASAGMLSAIQSYVSYRLYFYPLPSKSSKFSANFSLYYFGMFVNCSITGLTKLNVSFRFFYAFNAFSYSVILYSVLLASFSRISNPGSIP